MVLVQGVAEVDDTDLDANRERYAHDTAAKFGRGHRASAPTGARFDWYFTRIYLHVTPERALVWRDGDCEADPDLIELARPPAAAATTDDPHPAPALDPPARGALARVQELGRRYDTAVLSTVARDGYPFSIRVPVSTDRRGKMKTIHIDANPAATLPLLPGPACVTAHDHDEQLAWTRNFQVRGYLQGDRIDGFTVTPHTVLDGFELPPVGPLTRAVTNFRKIRRFRKTAKRERERRGTVQ
jgi:hypothetical protein